MSVTTLYISFGGDPMILCFSAFVAAQDYLSIASVQDRLIQEVPKLEACLKKEQSGSLMLSFSIAADGVLVLDEPDDCFKRLESIPFPSHPQNRNEYQWSLVIQDQKLLPIQLIEKKEELLLPGIFSLEKEVLLERLQLKKQERTSGADK